MKLTSALVIVLIYLISFNVYPQWYTQQSGTSDLLYSIQFTDINNGWVTNLEGIQLFHTTNGGIDWYVQKDFGTPTIWNFTFVDDSIGYFYSRGQGNLSKSTDGGSNWQLIHTFGPTVYDVKWYDENTGWCITFQLTGSLIKTTNGGIDWQGFDYFNSFDGGFEKVGIINENSVIVPGYYYSGEKVFFKTTDGGTTWTEIPTNLDMIGRIQFINDNIGWIESSWGLYKTSDGGFNWEQQVTNVFDFDFINENIGWYINGNQIKMTTDGGFSWTSQNSGTNNTLHSINFVDQNYGWISGDNGTILHTINGGTPVELVSFKADVAGDKVNLSWLTATEFNNRGFEIQKSTASTQNGDWKIIGFIDGNGSTTKPHSYSFTEENLTSGKYSYRLKQIDFDGTFRYSQIIEAEVNLSREFSLSQNYPNPFNPVTTIKYSLPSVNSSGGRDLVTLKVYDVLGNEIRTLVSEEQSPGFHKVIFDAENLPSGVYIYRLTAGSYSSSRKLILLK